MRNKVVRGVGNQIDHKKHGPTRNLKRNQKKSIAGGKNKNAGASLEISTVGSLDVESVVADDNVGREEELIRKKAFEERRQLFKTSKLSLAQLLLEIPHYHDFDKVVK